MRAPRERRLKLVYMGADLPNDATCNERHGRFVGTSMRKTLGTGHRGHTQDQSLQLTSQRAP
ncbi:MAG: hypothetical protein HY898_01420 [Deltaproteobacteria bacterium]|nr:hypothetical protein [Deltaproteobacteria bacterium]